MIGREVPADVARRRHVRLVAVLLEEHPLQHLRAAERCRRHEARILGQVPEDGVRLGQEGAVVELQGRDAAVWVLLQEFRRARLTLVDVDLGPLVLLPELRQQQPDLVAVAGIQVVEEVHGVARGCLPSRQYRAMPRASRAGRLFPEAKLFLFSTWHEDFLRSMPCAPSRPPPVSAASSRPPASCACPRPRSASRCAGSSSTSTPRCSSAWRAAWCSPSRAATIYPSCPPGSTCSANRPRGCAPNAPTGCSRSPRSPPLPTAGCCRACIASASARRASTWCCARRGRSWISGATPSISPSVSRPRPAAGCTARRCAARSSSRWPVRSCFAADACRTRFSRWPNIRCCTTSTP